MHELAAGTDVGTNCAVGSVTPIFTNHSDIFHEEEDTLHCSARNVPLTSLELRGRNDFLTVLTTLSGAWPEKEKLYGELVGLKRTAVFVKATGVDV